MTGRDFNVTNRFILWVSSSRHLSPVCRWHTAVTGQLVTSTLVTVSHQPTTLVMDSLSLSLTLVSNRTELLWLPHFQFIRRRGDKNLDFYVYVDWNDIARQILCEIWRKLSVDIMRLSCVSTCDFFITSIYLLLLLLLSPYSPFLSRTLYTINRSATSFSIVSPFPSSPLLIPIHRYIQLLPLPLSFCSHSPSTFISLHLLTSADNINMTVFIHCLRNQFSVRKENLMLLCSLFKFPFSSHISHFLIVLIVLIIVLMS